jgi:hypothetical protein
LIEVLDNAFAAAKLGDAVLAAKTLQHNAEGKTRGLRPADRLADFAEIFLVKTDEIAERLGVAAAAGEGRLTAIYSPLDIEGPFLRILATAERVVDIFPLTSHLNSPGTGLEPGEGGHDVCAPCAPRRRTRAKKRRVMA